MTIYYSFRELLTNFASMWKLLLYRLIVLILSISLLLGLAMPTLTYIYDEIAAIGFFDNLSGFFSGIFSGGVDIGSFGEALKNNIVQIGQILLANITRLLLTYIYILLSLCLSRFFNCIADYAITDVINCNMEACVKTGFVSSIFSNLGKAVKFALVKIMFTVPFDGIITALIIYMFVALYVPLGIFMPFIVALVAILLISFRMTLFSGWLPYIVSDGYSIFGALHEGVKSVFKHFWNVYSNWIILSCTLMILTLIITIFTFGVGLIVVIPICILLYNIFYLVFNYNTEGKRYYIDHENIVTPKSLHDREALSGGGINNNVFYNKKNTAIKNLRELGSDEELNACNQQEKEEKEVKENKEDKENREDK